MRDQNLAFEMFKKGDLDNYYVNISREWVEELNFDRVQRGLIQKRKIFNDNPSGIQGVAFNTRKEPFSDIRVRKALTLLQNRQLLIERLFFNEYVPQNSYYSGGIYENANNPKNEYDPQAALALLAEAGWSTRDGQGRLVKNGQPLVLELLYNDKGSERWITIYQEELGKVGIGLNLRLVTPETLFRASHGPQLRLRVDGLVGPAVPEPGDIVLVVVRRSTRQQQHHGLQGCARRRAARRLRPRVRPAEARSDHPGDRRHPGELLSVHLRRGTRRSSASPTGTSSAIPRATSRASATTATCRRSGGSIRRRKRSCAARSATTPCSCLLARPKYGTGANTRREKAAAAGQ